LKGPELVYPDGREVPDAHGIPRKSMRVRWWGTVAGLPWSETAIPSVPDLPTEPVAWGGLDSLLGYDRTEPPVFFGHYKLTRCPTAPQAANVAILDYGLGHGGAATAYRWNGESVLRAEGFVQVPAQCCQFSLS